MDLTAESHTVPLSDGNRIPLLGLGTYADPRTVRLFVVIIPTCRLHGQTICCCFVTHVMSFQTAKGTALECVKNAIDVGYRHFDGALVYFNEHEVGQAIREKIADGTVKREDIFYCGKVHFVTAGPTATAI